MEELSIGSRAPDFRLLSNEGGEIGLSDYYRKSAVILFLVREYE